MHGHPGGLVDHQQMLILENHRPLDELLQPARRPAGLLRMIDVHGGQPHLITGDDPVLGVHAFAIDPHFTLAQQPVDAASGHPAEVAHEKVVDSLPGFLLGYGAQLHLGLRARGLGALRRRGECGTLSGFGFHLHILRQSVF
jgi:hypothetical protein